MKPPAIKVEIIHIDGPLKGTIQEFFEETISIGRHPSCQVNFPSDMTTISRRHAEIRREGNRFIACDTSTNGTMVNGKPITEIVLKNGDVLTLAEGGPKISFLSTIMKEAPPQQHTETSTQAPLKPDSAVPVPETSPVSDRQEKIKQPPKPEKKTAPPSQQVVSTPFIIQYGPTIKTFSELPITIGRSADCDFPLEHFSVKARHAQIFLTDNGYFIKDLTERNLITINGKPVRDEALLPRHLHFTLT